MHRIPLVFLTLFFLSSATQSEPPKKEASTSRKWSIDDILLQESAESFQLAPDGKSVVWVKTAMDADKGESISQLFRTTLATQKGMQLTRGQDSCSSPRWSPDGNHIAFLSARPPQKPKSSSNDKPEEAKNQLWVMDASGGDPWPVTELRREVVAFEWAGNDRLAFIAQEDPTLRENTLKDDDKDNTNVVEDEKNEPPVRLFVVEAESKKVTRLSNNRDRIQSLSLSPDGKKAVTVHSRSLRYEYDNAIKPVVYVYDLDGGETHRVFKDEKLNIGQVRWSPDGKGFYATNTFTTHPRYVVATITELLYHNLASGKEEKVDLDWERGISSEPANSDGPGFFPIKGGVIVLLADGAHIRIARYVREGAKWKRQWLEGEHVGKIYGVVARRDGQGVLYPMSSASQPIQWYHARLEGQKLQKPMAITKLNESFSGKPKSRVELFRWKGALQEEVDGLLYFPHDYKEGQKYPLVLMIHGGPFGVDQDMWDDSWAYAPNLYASRGAFVFRPNYHGSSNYGLRFAESIANGKYYEYPLTDIENGVEALIERGLIIPEKLGTIGWSNGSILSVALLTRSTRYKAASLGAGGAEWVGDWGACQFGMSFSNYYFGKSPVEDPQLYLRMAPLYQFDKIKTPSILFQGEADRSVPPHHGWSQFRTLQEHRKADVRLVLFPQAEHSLKKLAHQRRKMKEELAWFDKYLFAKEPEDGHIVKEGSPLDVKVKVSKAKREGKTYGIRDRNGILIPETVEYEEMKVGRFEVTATQFAAFDKTYNVEPGKENLPAAGITFEKAKEYCQWLSKQTGRKYRLPNEKESDKLYDESDSDNTLDYWAGYSVNPEDSEELRKKVQQLPGKAPLLIEVGKFKGVGEEEQVFDLGGNVAEWVVLDDGKGESMGGCASLPSDPKQSKRETPPEYIGFRVILEREKK